MYRSIYLFRFLGQEVYEFRSKIKDDDFFFFSLSFDFEKQKLKVFAPSSMMHNANLWMV